MKSLATIAENIVFQTRSKNSQHCYHEILLKIFSKFLMFPEKKSEKH